MPKTQGSVKRSFSTIDNQLQKALAFIEKGRLEEALSCYTQIIDQSPQCIPALIARGNILKEQGKYKEAFLDFDQVLYLSPSAEIYFAAFTCLKQMNELSQSLVYISKALFYEPHSVFYLIEKGNICDDLGYYDQAIECCTHAITQEPRKAEAHYLLAVVLCRLNQYEHALAEYNCAIELGFNDRSVFINRGILLAQKGHFEAAIKDFTQALESG